MKYLCSVAQDFSVGEIDDDSLSIEISSEAANVNILLSEENTYVVLVCFEEGDDFREVKESCARIESLYRSAVSDLDSISLVPFSHLSEFAMADLALIEKLIEKMHRVLRNKGLTTKLVTVKSANIFIANWLLVDKYDGVKFGSSSSSLKSILTTLLRAYGPQKVLQKIGELLILKSER